MKRIEILIALLIVLITAMIANAQDFNNVKYIRNHDGDTFTFDLGASLPPLFREMPLRLYGIDTPEIVTKNPKEKAKAILARDFAKNQLIKAKQINLVQCGKDKYFRINCRVNYDGNDLTNELLKHNYGYAYFGEKKKVINYD